MKKIKISIQGKNGRIIEQTHNISEEMFFLVTSPLQNWGKEVYELLDEKYTEVVRDNFFNISDTIMEKWIEKEYDLKRREYHLVDNDIDPYNDVVEYYIDLK